MSSDDDDDDGGGGDDNSNNDDDIISLARQRSCCCCRCCWGHLLSVVVHRVGCGSHGRVVTVWRGCRRREYLNRPHTKRPT